MINIIATFNNIIGFKKLLRTLRKNPKVKGHIYVIHKKEDVPENETYISSVLIKRSREISQLKLEDTVKGILFGAVIGGLSSLLAVVFNFNLLHVTTLSVIATLALIFYGAAVGSIIGLLIGNLIRKYDEANFAGEMTLVIKEVDDDTRDTIVNAIKEYNPVKLNIY